MKSSEYVYQKEANIAAFIEDAQYEEREMKFVELVVALKDAGVRYGLACSMNLYLRGIVDEFHDFDLVVEAEDVPLIKTVMEDLGAKLVQTGSNGYCKSDYFMHYELDRVDVDIISGFRVVTFGTQFLYEFDENEVETIELEDLGITVPMISLEAQYLLYAMMEGWQPKRRFKRVLIRNYLLQEDIKFRNIFEDAMQEQLPSWIRQEVKGILRSK